jgi:hypothetical protein
MSISRYNRSNQVPAARIDGRSKFVDAAVQSRTAATSGDARWLMVSLSAVVILSILARNSFLALAIG